MFLMFLNYFDVLILKIIFFLKKFNIYLVKNILKNNSISKKKNLQKEKQHA
jgi:hypothetical protein